MACSHLYAIRFFGKKPQSHCLRRWQIRTLPYFTEQIKAAVECVTNADAHRPLRHLQRSHAAIVAVACRARSSLPVPGRLSPRGLAHSKQGQGVSGKPLRGQKEWSGEKSWEKKTPSVCVIYLFLFAFRWLSSHSLPAISCMLAFEP